MSAVRLINDLLSSRWCSWLLLFAALTGRVFSQLYTFKLGSDRALQLLCARNFSDGLGLNLNIVSPSDINTEIYQPLVGWPPGYPVMVGSIRFVTGTDIFVSALLFDVFCIALFIVCARQIVRILSGSRALANLATIVTGFFLYDFFESSTSDLDAVAFLLCSLFLSILLIQDKRRAASFAVLLGLINFVPSFLKYQYLPVSIFIPLYIFFSGWKTKDQRLRTGGLVAGGITFVLLLAQFMYQQNQTGNFAYVYPVERGFYPRNLLELAPFVFGAFMKLDFYYTTGADLGLISYGQFTFILWILNILITSVLLFLLARHYRQKRFLKPSDHFILSGSGISLVILSLLIFLSASHASTIFPDGPWTYVGESRYLAFLIIFLQLLFFVLSFNYWKSCYGKWKVAVVIIACLFSFEVAHGLYFTTKTIIRYNGLFGQNETFRQQRSYISQLAASYGKPPVTVVFAVADGSYAGLAAIEEQTVIYGLPDPGLFTTAAAFTVVYLLKDHDIKAHPNILNDYRVKYLQTIGSLHFYEFRSRKNSDHPPGLQ